MDTTRSEQYYLELTETFQRFYYSSEPVLVRNEVTEYPLEKGTEIATSCGFLAISELIVSDGEAVGARIDYYDDDGEAQSARILPDRQAHIRFIEGEGEVYRISDCTFKIIRK